MNELLLELIALVLAGIYVGIEINNYYWLMSARKAVAERIRMADLELKYGRRAGVYNVRKGA